MESTKWRSHVFFSGNEVALDKRGFICCLVSRSFSPSIDESVSPSARWSVGRLFRIANLLVAVIIVTIRVGGGGGGDVDGASSMFGVGH